MPHVLIVDDDKNTRDGLSELIAREGFTTATASSLSEAQERIERQKPDVLLLDVVMPDGSGLDFLENFENRSMCETVFITGHASIESSVQALRLGASDYLLKPIRIAQLRRILGRVARPTDLKTEIATLRDELRRLGRFGRLIGTSQPMQWIYDQISRVAPTGATVMITGESGTGKEVVAQTLHDLSPRHKHAFLPVNCGAISPQLIESELFGHEKGSFTGAVREHRGYFERASGGTLFLDEVTEMPVELQVKLLRVLETRLFMRVGSDREIETDVRIIAATNRPPEEAVAEGKLRADLLYRLQVFPLHLPPLRERLDDIELLSTHFLKELNQAEGTAKTFTPGAVEALKRHQWPGNLRELKNIVHRAFILANDVISEQSLPPEIGAPQQPTGPCFTVRVGSTVAEVERSLILATIQQCDGTKEQAAEMLGISLKTLYNRLKEYQTKPSERAESRTSTSH